MHTESVWRVHQQGRQKEQENREDTPITDQCEIAQSEVCSASLNKKSIQLILCSTDIINPIIKPLFCSTTNQKSCMQLAGAFTLDQLFMNSG